MSEDKVKPFVQSPFDTPITGLSTSQMSKVGKKNSLIKIEAPTAPKATRLPIANKEFKVGDESENAEIVDENRVNANTP